MDADFALPCGWLRIVQILRAADKTPFNVLTIMSCRLSKRRCKGTNFFRIDQIFFFEQGNDCRTITQHTSVPHRSRDSGFLRRSCIWFENYLYFCILKPTDMATIYSKNRLKFWQSLSATIITQRRCPKTYGTPSLCFNLRICYESCEKYYLITTTFRAR